jgi:hypothetical protein
MELSIIYRVVYDPRRTLEKFAQRPYYEALIPALAIALFFAVRAYLGMLEEGSVGPVAAIFGLVAVFMYSSCGMLIPPLLNALYVYMLRARMGNTSLTIRSLLTAFVLCSLPLYIGILFGSLSSLLYFGMGDVFRFLAEPHRFLFIVLATLTPYFLWTIVLWWTAATVLVRAGSYQRLFLIGSFAMLYILTSEFLSQAMVKFIRPG